MTCYVYILESEIDGSFYKGISFDPLKRLHQHNEGETLSTRHKIPWKLVYAEPMPSKTEALRREKNLKKYSRERLIKLIHSPKNVLKNL